MRRRKLIKWVLGAMVIWSVSSVLLLVLFRPSHYRDWELGHEQLPQIIYSATSSQIRIENYRNFVWTDAKVAVPNYETRGFDLNKITGVDVFISHFDDFEGLAHIFLSFGFNDGEQVVISLETRRETDETFSPLLGLLRQFEIIYVVGSEADIVGVRTGYRNERVYLYPAAVDADQARKLFDKLALDVNEVYAEPRMYNTLTNNCTNELTRPVEQISEIDFPLTWKSILPGYFDEVLYGMGLIDTGASFAEVKARHLLSNTALNEQSETYSAEMRQKKTDHQEEK